MAQPSVAREPSMEEILASIRRIIESNDPITESPAVSMESDFDDEDDAFELTDEIDNPFLSQVAANDPGSPAPIDIPSLRPTVQPAVTQRETPVEFPEKTLSLADVAARVRAAAGRVPEPVAQRPPVAQQPVAPQPPAEVPAKRMMSVEPVHGEVVLRPVQSLPDFLDMPPQAQVQPAPVPDVVERDMPVAAPMSQDLVAERPERVVEEKAAPAETVDAAADKPAAEPAVSLPAKIEEAASLLSEQAGEQVARSFRELADIFNGIERQSVEDMAREMLKPMLREWLDDNLPTLVERLVREEIERVARGPRR